MVLHDTSFPHSLLGRHRVLQQTIYAPSYGCLGLSEEPIRGEALGFRVNFYSSAQPYVTLVPHDFKAKHACGFLVGNEHIRYPPSLSRDP